MEQPGTPADESHDVLSIGESRTPGWVRPVAVLVVLLLGIGAYRILAAPPNPAAPAPAAAQEQPVSAFGVGGRSALGPGTGRDTTVRLGDELVTLRGPGVQVPERETSASALGRIGHGWLVRLISKACKGSTGTRTLYGVARASGRFTRWDDSSRAGQGPTWRSPDRSLILRAQGRKVELHRSSTGEVVATFRTD
ncbi:MAG: hypothetical protein QOK15_3324 [Nocardioidaceae bacterium]|jgi:hypothetical protein|nr:hypothetical protein [Nocardioidaceae bacterium]